MIILDTDTLTLVHKQESPAALRVRARIAEVPVEEWLGTTVVTYQEHCRGWLAYIAAARTKAAQINGYRLLAKHAEDYREVRLTPFDVRAADKFEEPRKDHRRIGTMDLRIAAIAVTRNALLVTRNLSDFADIEGLRTEDWTK